MTDNQLALTLKYRPTGEVIDLLLIPNPDIINLFRSSLPGKPEKEESFSIWINKKSFGQRAKVQPCTLVLAEA